MHEQLQDAEGSPLDPAREGGAAEEAGGGFLSSVLHRALEEAAFAGSKVRCLPASFEVRFPVPVHGSFQWISQEAVREREN